MVYLLLLIIIVVSLLLLFWAISFILNNKPIQATICILAIFGSAIVTGIVCEKIENKQELYQVNSCILYTNKENTIYEFLLVGQNGRQLKLYIPSDKVSLYYNGKNFKISEKELMLLT